MRMNWKSIIITSLFILFSVLSLTMCGSGGGKNSHKSSETSPDSPSDLGWIVPQTNPENITTLPTGEEVSSEIVSISVKETVSRTDVEKIITDLNGTISGELPELRAYYIKFNVPKQGNEIKSIIEQLRQNPNIETASPDYIYKSTGVFPSTTDIETPNLLTEERKWGFTRIKMSEAWSAIRKSGRELSDVVVAVIDSGFDLEHPDLKDNFILEVNGKQAWDCGDNDDDVSYDLIECQNEDHGTNVCGIVAAVINGEDINGVAPTAKIFPLKFESAIWKNLFCEDKMYSRFNGSTICYAIVWAVMVKVDVINMSFGDPNLDSIAYQQTLEYQAIQMALKRGIVIVASVGNTGESSNKHYPSAVEGIIAVGAIDENDRRSVWPNWPKDSLSSNYSDSPSALWIAAPGTNVYTTSIRDLLDLIGMTKYDYVDGTSIAAPFVAGCAALLKQLDYSLTNVEIADILRDTADDIQVTYPEDTSLHTWKRLNALNAVNAVLKRLGVNNEPPVNTLPIVSILCPSDNDIFTAGDEVSFSGNATDIEDGTLSGNSLVWTSDKDGQIGAGESLSITTLSVNTHIITLTATDFKGGVKTASVSITIKAQPSQSTGDWPMEGHDPARTNATSETLQVPLVKVWEFAPISESGDRENFGTPPVVKDGILYISSYYHLDGTKIHAININTGAQIYECIIPKGIINSLTVAGGFLYAIYDDYSVSSVSSGKKLGAYRINDGSLAWRWAFNEKYTHSILVIQGKVFVNVWERYHPIDEHISIYVLDADTGHEIGLPLNLPELYVSNGSFSDNIFCVISPDTYKNRNSKIYAINMKTRKQIWDYVCPGDVGCDPVISSGICLVGYNYPFSYSLSYKDEIYGIDLETGVIKWNFLLDDDTEIFCPFAVSDNVVYVGTVKYSNAVNPESNSEIIAINIQSGKKLWEFDDGKFIVNYLAVSGNLVFALTNNNSLMIDNNRRIIAIRKDNGQKVWDCHQNEFIRYFPIIASGKLIFVEGNNAEGYDRLMDRLVAFGPQ